MSNFQQDFDLGFATNSFDFHLRILNGVWGVELKGVSLTATRALCTFTLRCKFD
jgi:hypothetical protein